MLNRGINMALSNSKWLIICKDMHVACKLMQQIKTIANKNKYTILISADDFDDWFLMSLSFFLLGNGRQSSTCGLSCFLVFMATGYQLIPTTTHFVRNQQLSDRDVMRSLRFFVLWVVAPWWVPEVLKIGLRSPVTTHFID